jgi:dCMP deaminase
MERPTWDEYFQEIVQVTAKRSPCERLQVGCVLVLNNRIVSQGYNGFLPGCAHVSIVRDDHEQATVHAEQNAIADCAKRGVSCSGCTAYVTHYPCLLCCRIMLASGITHIKYIHDYRNDPIVKHLADQMGIPVEKCYTRANMFAHV